LRPTFFAFQDVETLTGQVARQVGLPISFGNASTVDFLDIGLGTSGDGPAGGRAATMGAPVK
jgi:hypothetical protein